MTEPKATTAQREYLTRLLIQAELIRQGRDWRTGPMWRPVFKAAGTTEPDALHWPTADEWIGSLSVHAASRAINHLVQAAGGDDDD